MVVTSKVMWALGALLSMGALAAACGSSGGATAGGCVPNAQVSCACLGGTTGIQVCGADGKSYGACQCGSTTSGTGGTTSTTTTTTGSACQCVNPGGELYCGAAACGTGTGGSTTTGDAGKCATQVTFAGKAGMQFGSTWSYGSAMGLAAGDAACQDVGADHVCDYDDIVLAASKGELSSLATTDTAWLQRTHAVTITATSPDIVVLGGAMMGATYDVNSGSRCNNWFYSTDHVNDGEFVEFKNGGNKPTFHLDDKTGDGTAANANIQPTPKDIPCGHATPRSVLCCYPKCM